jgi:ABC-type taurine transport system ATPase subunit
MEIRMRKFEASSVASDATVVFFGKSGSGKTYLVPRGRRGRSAVSCY